MHGRVVQTDSNMQQSEFATKVIATVCNQLLSTRSSLNLLTSIVLIYTNTSSYTKVTVGRLTSVGNDSHILHFELNTTV